MPKCLRALDACGAEVRRCLGALVLGSVADRRPSCTNKRAGTSPALCLNQRPSRSSRRRTCCCSSIPASSSSATVSGIGDRRCTGLLAMSAVV